MNTLIISHLPGPDSTRFQVERASDQKKSQSLSVTSPFEFPVEGSGSSLMGELRWYLEDFLEYPFHPNTDRAARLLDALRRWGGQAFNELFDNRDAGGKLEAARRDGAENMCVQIMSDDPRILQWPWETLLDPMGTYLAVACRIERRINRVDDPMPLPENLPKDRINILLVTARPYENDVHYRSISRPLVELIERDNIPAQVHVLRPPTFANLRAHLEERPGFYHVLHFDGHGGFGQTGHFGEDRHRLQGPEGVLVFENEKEEADLITAEQLSGLLRGCSVPVVVLNACRSGMLDHQAEEPFTSVAAALLKTGIRGVVAMAYSLYVSGAQEFLPAFYAELFKTGDLSRAAWRGRQKMFEQKKRVCASGKCELWDFVVPVIYQQEGYDLSFMGGIASAEAPEKKELPGEAQDDENPYGFIGRDRELLRLERAMRRDTPAILIHGLGGVGKTTLARGFLKWLGDTEGMDGCLWLPFIDIRSAEYVVNSIGSAIFGTNFIAEDMEDRLDALAAALRGNRLVIVWDNFEVVAGIPDTYVEAKLPKKDRGLLLSLLKKIRGGKSKVIITSRSEEKWLKPHRLKMSIGGLVGEERWEYCEKILDNLGISINRTDPDQMELMELLGGHPLAMRIILPMLEDMSARQVIAAVQSNMEALGPDAEKLYATLRFVEEKLAEPLRPLLVSLALHERFVDSDYLEGMAKQVNEKWTRKEIDGFTQALAAAGLLRGIRSDTYELHPALTGFLRSTVLASASGETREAWARAFVDVMGSLADALAPRELHEQRGAFHCHGVNFRFALSEAERLDMLTDQCALTQSLAAYAQNTMDFAGAGRLFERLAEMHKKAGDKEGEAAAYHQLGRIAQERRDFDSAEKWYKKSLAISEKQRIEHGAASTYGQLGIIAGLQGDFEVGGKWLIKCIVTFLRCNDSAGAERNASNFIIFYKEASPEEQKKLRALWEEAGMGPFPDVNA